MEWMTTTNHPRNNHLIYKNIKMTEELTPTSLENLKEENKRLKNELEMAKLEAENRELREEIYRLKYPNALTSPYTPRPWDNITLCNNK